MRMIKIMFVCHGNICRSPMAEMILKEMVRNCGRQEEFLIRSAATSTEEIIRGVGNPVYPPARAELERHGVFCEARHAVQLQWSDYSAYDLFIGMDSMNIRNMKHILRGDPEGKIRRMMDFIGSDEDVADPWYSGKFDTVYAQLARACTALLQAYP